MHMDFFISVGIIGISLILSSKLAMKGNKNIQQYNNWGFLSKLLSYMDSELLAKINLKYGTQLLICGIIGTLFYNTLGLLMVAVTILNFIFYLANIFINGYKYCFVSR